MGETITISKKKVVSIAVIAGFFLVLWLFPVDQWDSRITSGRLVNEATIVDVNRTDGYIVAQIENSGCLLKLSGNIPAKAVAGRSILIGYSDSDGIIANPSQKVEIAYFVQGNALQLLLKSQLSIRAAADDLQITDYSLTSNPLVYNKAS